MIIVAQDSEGIRMAALELREESLNSEALQRQLSRLAPDDPQIEKLVRNRELAEGYYIWTLYLMWLRNQMSAGIPVSELSADEAEGLMALALAEQDFERKYPRCGSCGERGHSARFCPRRAS